MRPRVVITHWVHQEVLDLLRPTCDVVSNPTRETLPRAEVLRRAREAEALLAFMPDHVDDRFLAECPRLRIVAAALKGYDNFDVEACRRRAIWFTIVPDLLTVPTAELAVCLLLALARRVPEGDAVVRSGQFAGWKPQLYGTGLSGRAAGIIGMGAVGRAVARRLQAFEARVLYCDRQPLSAEEGTALQASLVPFEELLERSDFVLPLVPLTPETLHLMGAAALARMKSGAFLVNVSRGSVVDEKAVASAIASGRLAGYAADVFELEDWERVSRPRRIAGSLLLDRARTLFTPHLGSAVDDVRREVALAAARSILEALDGKPPSGAL